MKSCIWSLGPVIGTLSLLCRVTGSFGTWNDAVHVHKKNAEAWQAIGRQMVLLWGYAIDTQSGKIRCRALVHAFLHSSGYH